MSRQARPAEGLGVMLNPPCPAQSGLPYLPTLLSRLLGGGRADVWGISRSGGRHPEKFSFDVCSRRGLEHKPPGFRLLTSLKEQWQGRGYSSGGTLPGWAGGPGERLMSRIFSHLHTPSPMLIRACTHL